MRLTVSRQVTFSPGFQPLIILSQPGVDSSRSTLGAVMRARDAKMISTAPPHECLGYYIVLGAYFDADYTPT